jgi:aspartate carbamoyltransferase
MLRDKIERQPVIISAGDGIGEHPSQALLDMFTVVELKGQLDGLSITLVGDLKHGRTVHSLARLVARLEGQDVTIHCVSPPALRMPDDILARLRAKGISVTETDDLYNVLGKSDVIYWTRVQEERFDDPAEYESIKDGFIMTPPVLAQAKADAILMHPLPRKHEMGTQADHDILDADPRSVYFQQMENGMYVRMALLTKVLRGVHV